MNDARLVLLNLVAEGKLAPEDAHRLIAALDAGGAPRTEGRSAAENAARRPPATAKSTQDPRMRPQGEPRRIRKPLRRHRASTLEQIESVARSVGRKLGRQNSKAVTADGSHMPSYALRHRASGRGPWIVSLVVHGVGALIVAVYIARQVLPEAAADNVPVEMVSLPDMKYRRIFPRKQIVQRTESVRLAETTITTTASPDLIPEVVTRTSRAVRQTVDLTPRQVQPIRHEVQTAAELSHAQLDSAISAPSSTPQGSDAGRGVPTGRVRAAGREIPQRGLSIVERIGAEDLGMAGAKFADTTELLRDDELGAVLVGRDRDLVGHIRLIRVKHTLSDWWQDPTALSSLIDWIEEHSRLRGDMKFAGGALRLDDPRILDAPLLIMTGHDKDITVSHQLVKEGPLTEGFTDAERANLRRYLLDRGGTLYFDDCGFNGVFAEQVRQELEKSLPEYDLLDIPNNHEIYTTFFELAGPPQGGDIFWGSENNPHISYFPHQKGITINGRLAVIYNRKDYLCAMETTEVESRTMLRLRRSLDVYRFMTNLFIYAMKYGGNTDRSQYSYH